ncbi:hypothetical protein BDV28DRAFT_160206 [Aspergillus coremiiformis]|uniref:Uncharacterized protein n=1 Tax=Aspergillus coremiiformis TaxID=138285 RepID=A0A5N6YXV7_9EURO|nr:hypothetical protein BDV28DRAFT_160206 [Aspergillus coremiiformis]
MSTITQKPTLNPAWTPSVYGCRAKGDFWIWDFHADDDRRTVLGGPSQTTNCFPSTWNPTAAYDGTRCPVGYSSACTSGRVITKTVCCPTIYEFSCVEDAYKKPHGVWFPCVSQYDTPMKRIVTRTDFAMNTIGFLNVTQATNRHLFALGMVYATPTATASINTSSPTPDPSPTDQSAISVGAAAGIGVGCGVGVMLITLVAWFLIRRNRSATPDPVPVAEHAEEAEEPKPSPVISRPHELEVEPAGELPG